MTENPRVARFSPATPRSRRLGRELKKLREAAGLTLEQAGKKIGSSPSRVHRVESGDIKVRAGDVMELLDTYEVPIDSEPARSLLAMARELREVGWWQRLDALPPRLATMIAYEEEASEIRTFEPMLVPGLLQTEAYARAVISIGREMNEETIAQRVKARMQRQQVLTRKPPRLRLHVIIAETVLLVEVGGPEIMREQLSHLVSAASRPNVTIQVLRFAAGAHMANHGGFIVMNFEDDPPLGYIDTLAGVLFLESSADIRRLTDVYDHLVSLALSPAESARYIREKTHEVAQVN